jgi:L-malate glycosyltransferase
MIKSRIKILYLIGQLGLGGSEKQLYILLKHMDKSRFEPQVVVFNPSNNNTLDDDLRKSGVPVYGIPESTRSIFSRLLWILKLALKFRPDILHSWTLHDNGYAALIGIFAGIPVRLGSLRGSLASSGFINIHAWIRWLILHGVNGHLVNSAQGIDELKDAGVPERRIKMLPNCIEIPLAIEKSNNSCLHQVGMVGNLRREKNYPLFLRGLSLVLPEFPDLVGIIVGQPVLPSDSEIPDQIQSEIDRLGLGDHIIQVGFCADVPSLLPEWEIFCLTSDSEGMPNAVLEAMAAGLPVIATHVGGIPQVVVHGKTGLLIPPRDEGAFADALRKLLEDPELSRTMGAEGRRRVEFEFSPEVVVPMLEKYYLDQIQ